jgi:hypothetical protein
VRAGRALGGVITGGGRGGVRLLEKKIIMGG